MDPYNGYTGRKRDKKYQEYKRLRDAGLSVPANPPCQLCNDPYIPVEPHSEDYSFPYLWTPPAEYMICRRCHGWIHKRFSQPGNWQDFHAHVRRGGYAEEFTSRSGVKERSNARAAAAKGIVHVWAPLDGRALLTGVHWWERLTMDPESLTARWARPRP